MTSFRYEIKYLHAGVQALEQYLLSDELYWPSDANAPTGERPYPRLTLGNLLLARARLYALPLSISQQAEALIVDEQIADIKDHWQVAWMKKAKLSYEARFKLWRDFLQEYKEDPEATADRYVYEVERRVMLNLLSPEVEDIPQAYRDMLAGHDLRLRGAFQAGEFIWDPQMAAGFPVKEYWYLFGTLAD